jgi:hypothetical protein
MMSEVAFCPLSRQPLQADHPWADKIMMLRD